MYRYAPDIYGVKKRENIASAAKILHFKPISVLKLRETLIFLSDSVSFTFRWKLFALKSVFPRPSRFFTCLSIVEVAIIHSKTKRLFWHPWNPSLCLNTNTRYFIIYRSIENDATVAFVIARTFSAPHQFGFTPLMTLQYRLQFSWMCFDDLIVSQTKRHARSFADTDFGGNIFINWFFID